jgi:hypothetical protein
LGRQIRGADHHDHQRLEEIRAQFQEAGEDAGHRNVRAGGVADEEIAEIRTLEPAFDCCAGGFRPQHHLMEFVGDAGAEQIGGAADDEENEQPGNAERQRLRRRQPAHEGLRAEPHQHGEDDGAERDQHDAGQVPDRDRYDGDGDDDERALEKFDVAHLLHGPPLSALCQTRQDANAALLAALQPAVFPDLPARLGPDRDKAYALSPQPALPRWLFSDYWPGPKAFR